MKITYLNSASVLIQDESVKILCDPWLEGEEYFGSWGIYPPYEFKPHEFGDVDFIYISHIHPDHCSSNTLSKLNKGIPVLIHRFPEKFLKNKIESLGFKVIELEHNLRVKLKNNLHINILAADNCDPQVCGKLMGCAFLGKYGTTQIDTMAVIDNEEQVIVNTNDCPYAIANRTALEIKHQYNNIDMILVGYVKASSYPQCFELDENTKLKEAEIKQQNKLATAIDYIKIFQPKYVIPFAGRYTLTGRNSSLNPYRGEPELEFVYDYLCQNIPQDRHKCIILNRGSYFDISTGKCSDEYKRIDPKKKQEYIENVFSKKKFDYENEEEPSTEELVKLIPRSYDNFEYHRRKSGWSSDTMILLMLSDDLFVAISCNGTGFKMIPKTHTDTYKKFLMITVDKRLLKWLLEGPKKAHWSTADIGNHIRYKRIPNTYERGLYYCWNYFYSDTV